MSRIASPLRVAEAKRVSLRRLARSATEPHRVVVRAQALLMAEEGETNAAMGGKFDVRPARVGAWRKGFPRTGLDRLARVADGRGRKPAISAEKVDEIVNATRFTKPKGKTHWSCRGMATGQGVSKATVQRIWSGRGLKPHLVETFKLSNDPKFEENLVDVVGQYRNTPDGAVVLCVDEKSQCQALDRTQPSLPIKPGRAGTMTHDYKRNGTTTLFAALNVLAGTVIGKCVPRHRNGEFLQFLRLIDKTVPKGQQVHLIVDNYGTHNDPNVKAWLAKHRRFHLHFIPTSSSWLNLVKRFFRDLSEQALRRGSFASVPELIEAI